MSFPETRLTFIERLASGDSQDDWRDFLRDYWGPVCRFALRSGAGNLADAEDVASQTFEVLWENRLLVRWVSNRSARLRSLLCRVVRKNLANRGRTRENRRTPGPRNRAADRTTPRRARRPGRRLLYGLG